MRPQEHALPPGFELEREYLIEKVLGQGGFGITYLARHVTLGLRVAIKEYFPTNLATRTAHATLQPHSTNEVPVLEWGRKRFVREAQALARFRHPGIVRVSRVFEANNTAYAVLDYEQGETLRAWRKAQGHGIGQGEIDALLTPLLDALEVMHADGLLHRDISPDNIIRRPDGSPVLIDFGSAKDMQIEQQASTLAMIKHGYSPIEQYQADASGQGPWTDIYAFAATLYFLITGGPPQQSIERTVADRHAPATGLAGAGYRAGFLVAIDHGLSVAPQSRPPTIAVWRAELLGATPPNFAPDATWPMPPEASGVMTLPTPPSAPKVSAPKVTAETVPFTATTDRLEGRSHPPASSPRSALVLPIAALSAVGLVIASLLLWQQQAPCQGADCASPPATQPAKATPSTTAPNTASTAPASPSATAPAPSSTVLLPPAAPADTPPLPPLVPEEKEALEQLASCLDARPCDPTCSASSERRLGQAAWQRLRLRIVPLATAAATRCGAKREASALAELEACARDVPCDFATECMPGFQRTMSQKADVPPTSRISEIERRARERCRR